MAKRKTPSKKYWLVYDKDGVVSPKLMTWAQRKKAKVRCNAFWDTIEPAERYLDYLNTRFKGE